MKMLKKLALVSAISAISVSAFAMEAMDDETMAATTGQDGITINIVPDVITRLSAASMGVTDTTMNQINANAQFYKGLSIGEIRVHDDDGVGSLKNSGALVIGGGLGAVTATQDRTVILAKGDKPIQINIDMVGDADSVTPGNQAMLNVVIKQPELAIKLGNIYVANSNAAEAGIDENGLTTTGSAEVDGSTVSDKVKILSGLEIVMAASDMIIQLGNEDSNNHMIQANATLNGGLTINNFELFDENGAAALNADSLLTGDVGSGGSIRAKSIKILDNGSTTVLTTQTGIDVGSRVSASTLSATGQETVVQQTFAVVNGNPTYAPALAAAGLTAASTRAQVDAEATNRQNIYLAARDAAAGGNYATATQAQKDAADADAGVIAAKGVADVVALLKGNVDGRVLAYNTATTTVGNWGGRDTYNGLVITSELGGATGADIRINNLALGDTNASVMGDVEILGLMLGKSKIVIMGH